MSRRIHDKLLKNKIHVTLLHSIWTTYKNTFCLNFFHSCLRFYSFFWILSDLGELATWFYIFYNSSGICSIKNCIHNINILIVCWNFSKSIWSIFAPSHSATDFQNFVLLLIWIFVLGLVAVSCCWAMCVAHLLNIFMRQQKAKASEQWVKREGENAARLKKANNSRNARDN